jgi:tetratricopeptide (TPR) repeat protein
MIVRDADDVIDATLQSVVSLADEIVVADTGSADGTRERLGRSPVRLLEIPWSDDFSAARNECARHAQGDWVLWLDAGESFTTDAARQLGEFVANRADPTRAYMLLVHIPHSPASIAGEQVAQVRLVPNHPAIKFRGRVRESLLPSVESVGLTVEGLPWRIGRPVQDHDPDRKRRKAQRNLRLADQQIAEEGPVARLLNCKADALQILDEATAAARYYSSAIQTAEPGTPELLEAYYGLLTALDGCDESREQQLTICLKALEAFPLDVQLLCAMGGYLQSQDRLDLAARAYQSAYRHGQIDPQVWHLDEIKEIAAVCYGLTLQRQNNDDMAQRALEEALRAYPQSERICRQLMELHIKHGRIDAALSLVEQLPDASAEHDSLRSAIRGACLANQNNWPAAKAYLQAAFRAGSRDPICLRWYIVTLLSVGDPSLAKNALEEWKKVDPASTKLQQYLNQATSRAMDRTAQVRVDPAGQTATEPAARRRGVPANDGSSVPDPPSLW